MPISLHQRRTPRTGEEIVEAPGKPGGTCITPIGPRSALKRTMYVYKAEVWCILGLLKNPFVTEEHLRMIFLYGGLHGYGAERSLGEGQYEYELTHIGTGSTLPQDVFEAAKQIKEGKQAQKSK